MVIRIRQILPLRRINGDRLFDNRKKADYDKEVRYQEMLHESFMIAEKICL